jgi:mRNA interferase RelE/StbE
MRVAFNRQALKALAGLQPARRTQIRDAIGRVAADVRAPNNNLRPLAGVPDGYRLRVGQWRVSFTVAADTLEVFEIAARGSAYRW